MSKALHDYYERELRFIRQLAGEFAQQYPQTADRLQLGEGASQDPHVERLIESFALLAGRIHHKLDDEFPELTDALLGVLYPHYLAPIPSMAIVQFEVDPVRAQQPTGARIATGTRLETQPVKGLPCTYRTAYPVTLWPVALTEAQLTPPPFPAALKPPPGTGAVLRWVLECPGDLGFADLQIDRLRFYLHGDKQIIPPLYELLFNQALQVVFRLLDGPGAGTQVVLDPARCLSQVGFEPDQGLLPYPKQSFLGYRLLTEFFTFPNKFLFLDLGGWPEVRRADPGRRLEVTFYLRKTLANLEHGVDRQMFRLGCTPVVNLFERLVDGIALKHKHYEYEIIPDASQRSGLEVYSVEAVAHLDATAGTRKEYYPFYSFRHGRARDSQQAFWYTSRRPSPVKDDRGTDVFLHLVDLGFNPRLPAESVLVAYTICTNRDLPADLQRAPERARFQLLAPAPVQGIHCLAGPTAPLRPPLRRGAYWRLISHLSLNHLSLTDSEQGREALQEMLRLYDFADSDDTRQLAEVTRQLIDGITALSSRRVVGRINGPTAGGFCRGIEVELEFDEEKCLGTGVFLYASVLERFLGLYATINSFCRLVATTKQGKRELKRWPPRAGELQLL